MYQIVKDLRSKVKTNRILYLSLDDPYLNASEKTLMKIFDLYANEVLHESLTDLKSPVYFLLDEVQYVNNWAYIVKRWFDLRAKIKFFVSGSSSLELTGRASEALVGRLTPQIILPMKYLEILRYKIAGDPANRRFDPVNWNLRRALKSAVTEKQSTKFYNGLLAAAKSLAAEKDQFLSTLNQYFLRGGYPELLTISDLETCAERLRAYLNLTLYKDVLRVGRVRDPEALEALVVLLAKNSSSRVNQTELARTLSLTRQTLSTYLFLLKSVYLISESEFYSESRAKRARREKKIYINDPGIRNILTGPLDDMILQDPHERGSIAETVIFEHTKRLKYNMEPGSRVDLNYWRNGGYETDIILELSRTPLPLEVKYTNSVPDSELRGIHDFLEDNQKAALGLVITNDLMEERDTILLVPAWLFLTMC